MTYLQAIILGFIQGISELFPVSSLGHSVILPAILQWKNLDQSNPFFLSFLVATHTATATVLLIFFWGDWKNIVGGLTRLVTTRQLDSHDIAARLGVLLLIGTIPACLLALALKKPITHLFANPPYAALFLLCNGIMLFFAERMRRKAPGGDAEDTLSNQRISRLGWKKAFGVGIAQAVALIPGFSRSGASMAGSLLVGLSNEDAARFSFLLATPIIAAASLSELPKLLHKANHQYLGPAFVGAACAAIGAYLSVRFLVRFFRTNRLTPFAAYCFVAGALACGYFFLFHAAPLTGH
jgi:undecaprenyl-diphosphatase